MKQPQARTLAVSALLITAAAGSALFIAQRFPRKITVDYPLAGSVFPPEFPPPTFLFRDASKKAALWKIDVAFEGGGPALHATTKGAPFAFGPIDPRAVSETNEPPRLTPEQAAARTWMPDAETWAAIKRRSTGHDATLTITGYQDVAMNQAVSRGTVRIGTSSDPVAAPIFYRDVPLMPAETEKGVIKPLAQQAVPLIAWRLRNVAETSSRVMMQGIYSCANCHSISRDGKTMGIDLDGPKNDKGLYALFPVQPQAEIRKENVIAWSTFRGKLGGKLRVGFMSQVSPTGEYVVTTINDPGLGQTDYERRTNPKDLVESYYVANFKQYRFVQVFYPTRGILAWYSKQSGILQPLPGADDPQYVHTNATWSPDGKYLVFSRAAARTAYPEGAKLAEKPNDPNETQIQYDLYRIPFNDGRGGKAEPIAGASRNGMSNSFPKISPDGRWLVFVEARNGQLMRPDSKLYIVPVEGGRPRRMQCNTPLMNSWHSFSPNGRWLVFSSKSRTPYTQMFLTHIDEQGNDTPAILIENSTASNRAVNIPEFMNIPPDGMLAINPTVTAFYRHINLGTDLLNKGQHQAAIAEFQQALADQPEDFEVHNSLGAAYSALGKHAEAIAHYRKAAEISPEYPDAHSNLGSALASVGKLDEAVAEFNKALELNPEFAEAHTSLGGILARQGRWDQAILHLRKAVESKPDYAVAQANLALALDSVGKADEAIPHEEAAVKISGGGDPAMLSFLGSLYAKAGRLPEAAGVTRQALDIATRMNDRGLMAELQSDLAKYQSAR
jgi:cytochrome c-type biogenesis protein CcmH/NrfG